MSKRLIVALAGVLAIGVLAAGCGGGSDSTDTSADSTGSSDTSSSAPALSKADFIKQGNAICEKTNEKTAEGIAGYITDQGLDEGQEPSEEQEEELVSTVILPLIQTEAEELGELGPPKGEEETVEEIVQGVEDVVAGGAEDPSSVVGGDDPFADVNKKAEDFGLTVCAEA